MNNDATASPAPGYSDDWVPLNAGHYHESWRGVADKEYIQDMYTHSTEPVDFDWDDVEDRLLEDLPEEL